MIIQVHGGRNCRILDHPLIMSHSGGFPLLYGVEENRAATQLHRGNRLKSCLPEAKRKSRISANPANRGRHTSPFHGYDSERRQMCVEGARADAEGRGSLNLSVLSLTNSWSREEDESYRCVVSSLQCELRWIDFSGMGIDRPSRQTWGSRTPYGLESQPRDLQQARIGSTSAINR